MSVFISKLKEQGYLDTISIAIGQVGSRKLGLADDYGSQDWRLFAPNLTIYGFDADQDACDVANANLAARNINWQEFHIPLALGKNQEEKTLYVTNQPMCSSLYPPNHEFIRRFAGMMELSGLSFSVEIETTTLDDFCQAEGVSEIDFLQIDVQGADLDVLQGAETLLSHSGLAIQIEVEFSPLYENQPLFADVDQYLRVRDFSLFGLELSQWNRSVVTYDLGIGRRQLLWADAFYLRDLVNPKAKFTKTPLTLFKLACIADILNFSDYALELFIYVMQNTLEQRFNCAECLISCLEEQAAIKQFDPQKLPAVNILRELAR